jgi:hypothetical protein
MTRNPGNAGRVSGGGNGDELCPCESCCVARPGRRKRIARARADLRARFARNVSDDGGRR